MGSLMAGWNSPVLDPQVGHTPKERLKHTGGLIGEQRSSIPRLPVLNMAIRQVTRLVKDRKNRREGGKKVPNY
ncbi:hypothetical protein Taro_038426 [Colocasia esculenta]|uniref:Uncharacterized protein n=1 Tax=Colocasia esculenta TaxID=4460 RepID=A0A843W6M8_COLES|nr:hypothetical protein [Colocasia esculenta]